MNFEHEHEMTTYRCNRCKTQRPWGDNTDLDTSSTPDVIESREPKLRCAKCHAVTLHSFMGMDAYRIVRTEIDDSITMINHIRIARKPVVAGGSVQPTGLCPVAAESLRAFREGMKP